MWVGKWGQNDFFCRAKKATKMIHLNAVFICGQLQNFHSGFGVWVVC